MAQGIFQAQAICRSARISSCGRYRWTLTRTWAEGESICWVMLNPSRADHRRDDPTIRRATQFTQAWGFAGLTVVNLCPVRTPHPADCRRWAKCKDAKQTQRRNAKVVARQAKHAAMIIAAWGGNAWESDWIHAIIGVIMLDCRPLREIYCLGTTKAGCPKHPLTRGKYRINDNQKPVLWRCRAK